MVHQVSTLQLLSCLEEPLALLPVIKATERLKAELNQESYWYWYIGVILDLVVVLVFFCLLLICFNLKSHLTFLCFDLKYRWLW